MIVLTVVALVLIAALMWMLWELRGLIERVRTVEQGQAQVGQNVSSLPHTMTTSLSGVTSSLQSEIAQVLSGLAEVRSQNRDRLVLEQMVADSIRRLESVIAGTQTKGAAGENIVGLMFSKLPADWRVPNFTVAGKTVEFALRLPNNRILPIDSKWPATGLIERFIASEDIAEQARLKAQIEDEVLRKAREVKKYVDGHQTVDYGVAVVPDAVYDLCPSVQSRCFIEHGVVLVAYSMFIPYVLLVVQTTLKTSQNIDLEKLETHLRGVEKGVRTLQQEIDGRFSRAMTFLENSRADMKAQLDRMDSSLTHLYLGAGMEQAGDEIEPASAVAAAHDLV